MKKRILYLLTGVLIGGFLFSAVPAIAAGLAVVPSTQPVTLNGKPVDISAFNIDGSNYFKLRDLAEILDFGLWYDEAVRTVRIEADKPFDPDYAGPGSTVKLGRIYIADYYGADGGFSALGLALDESDSEKILTVKRGDVLIVGGGQYKISAESLTLAFYTQPSLGGAAEWWSDYCESLVESGAAVKNN